MLEKFAGNILVTWVFPRQLKRNRQHIQTIHRHPTRGIRLVQTTAAAIFVTVEDADIVQTQKPALKNIFTGSALAVHPGGKVKKQFLKNPLKEKADPFSLALAAYFKLKDIQWPKDVVFSENHTLQWQELSEDGSKLISRKWKLPAAGNLPLLNFRSGWSSTGPAAFKHLSMSDLHELSRKTRETEGMKPLEGQILFVSYVTSGVGDFGTTAFGSHQPLVQLHSTAFNDLLRNSFLRRTPRWQDGLMLASVILMGWGASFTKNKKGFIAFWLTGVLTVFLAGIASVVQTRWVLPTASVMIVWTIALITELLRRLTYELIERLKLRAVMSYYFSPKVLQGVMANPGSMEPQQAELTVLLTDLRNFTTLSEILGPREIRHPLTNSHFEKLTEAYQIAFEKYHQEDFQTTARDFRELAETYEDGPSRLLAERCGQFADQNPQNWTGVYSFISK